jgi:rhodanese-related sulfurtransferase
MPPVRELSVEELAEKLRSQDTFILLDVREPWELESARIADSRLASAPMSRLAEQGLGGLPEPAQARDTELLVICHHGTRSAQVAGWLSSKGWARVFNVVGGIDEYARRVDPTVGSY